MAFALPFLRVLPAVGPLPGLTIGPNGPQIDHALPSSQSIGLDGINSINRGMFEPVNAAAQRQFGITKGRVYAEGARADSFGFVDGTGLRPKGPIDGTLWI